MRRSVLALVLLLLTATPVSAGVLFNSTTDALSAGTFTVPTTGTVCLNVYPNWAQTDNVEHLIFNIATGSGNDQFQISKFSNNSLLIGWQSGAVSYKVSTSSYTLNQSAWNTFCVTWDDAANETKAYLNGSQIGSTVTSLVTWNTAAETLYLGNFSASSTNMDGRLGEVAFWNRVLTSTELSNRMGGLLSNCIGSPVNYWPLVSTASLTDQGSGGENLSNSGVTDAADHPSTTACGGGGSPTVPTPTVVLGSGDTLDETDATSYTTASFPIVADELYTFLVTGRVSSGTPNTPTITCHSMTWVLIDSQADSLDQLRKVFLFRGMKSSASGSATCAIDFGGQTQLRSGHAVVRWSNVDTSGTNGSGAVVQSAKNAVSGTSLTVTLSAYSNSANRPYAVFYQPEAAATFNAESGWTKLYEQSGTENLAIAGMWRDDTTDSSPTMSNGGGSTEFIGIAIEIKAGTAAAASAVSILGGGVSVGGIID